MNQNQTLKETADALNLPVDVLISFIQAASQVIRDAERIKTCQLIVSMPRIIEWGARKPQVSSNLKSNMLAWVRGLKRLQRLRERLGRDGQVQSENEAQRENVPIIKRSRTRNKNRGGILIDDIKPLELESIPVFDISESVKLSSIDTGEIKTLDLTGVKTLD